MDEVSQVQGNQGIQNTQISQQQILQPSIGDSPKKRGQIRKIFNASSWFVFFTFLPVTVLILLSQNTIPGDLFYPVKRSMENVVLAAATVSPVTRVAFRTDLTERRFTEAETLLLARKDTTGFTNFIEEVVAAEQEISALSNQDAKKDVTEKLVKKIDEYQNKLIAIEAKREEETPTLITSKKESSSVSTSVEKPSTVATPQTSPLPTRTQGVSTPTPTYIEQQDIITSKLTPTSAILEPTLEVTATETLLYDTPQMPTIPSDTEESEEKDEKDEIAKVIDDTQKQLDEIKKQLEEESHKDFNEEGDEDKSSEVRKDEDHSGKEKDDDKKDREEDKDKEKEKRGIKTFRLLTIVDNNL